MNESCHTSTTDENALTLWRVWRAVLRVCRPLLRVCWARLRDVGLFCRYVGLFCKYVGLFCVTSARNRSKCQTRWLLLKMARCLTLLYIECCRCCVLQCVAVCGSVLQCVVMCSSVLQCVAVCCDVLQCVAVCCSVLQYVGSVLQCVRVCCSVLQCVTVCWSCTCSASGSPLYRFRLIHMCDLTHSYV